MARKANPCANPCGKTRPVDKPYEIWTSRDGSWEHRVLKKWQADDSKPYARWFIAVKSPFTYGDWEYGDSYVEDVKSGNTRTYVDPTFILSDCEKSAIHALDPALTPLCVSFVGMQETSSRAFGLYNIEEALCDDLPLHSTVSLQTIAVHGFRPVMV